MLKIEIKKLAEAPNPVHPNNIVVGSERVRQMSAGQFRVPEVGHYFCAGTFMTSRVQEIINDSTFRTLNSIYEWRVIHE